jgi:2-methylcitrate dehydratase PrpD
VYLDEEYERQYTDEGKLPARVEITLRDGIRLKREVVSPLGEKGNPILKEDHLLKIRTLINASPYRNVSRYARKFIPS